MLTLVENAAVDYYEKEAIKHLQEAVEAEKTAFGMGISEARKKKLLKRAQDHRKKAIDAIEMANGLAKRHH